MQKYFLSLFLLLTFLVSTVGLASQNLIAKINYKYDSQKLNITFVIKQSYSHPVKYKIFSINHPDRVVIDFQNVVVPKDLLKIPPNDWVKNIRSSHWLTKTSSLPKQQKRLSKNEGHNWRIVFDLKQKVTFKSSFMTVAEQKAGYGTLQITLTKLSPSATLSTKADSKETIQSVEQTKTAAPISEITDTEQKTAAVNNDKQILPKQPKVVLRSEEVNHQKRVITIVIDAGHGGRDYGATGHSGTHEKDIVLNIAKDLGQILNNHHGFRIVLTRNRDYFIPLRERLRIAQYYHADMFISIHADAYFNSYASGASIFALSPHGATSEAARWLAQKENESELGKVLADKDQMLRSVLIDLTQTATIATSLNIANDIRQQINKVVPLRHNFTEQAAFVVLKEPEIPSLLIETGFISNPDEERKLNDANYQLTIAEALADGIEKYFATIPV